MKFVSRSAWGARPPKDSTPARLNLGQVRGMAVHYEARDRAGTRHEQCAGIVRGIQAFHMDGRGWNDIAYSFLVCRHGYVFEGRGWGIRTAANGTNDANAAFHAVCYLEDDDPNVRDTTPEALSALAAVIRECRERGFGSEVKPHRAFKPTSCPGEDLCYWIAMEGWKTAEAPEAPEASEKPADPDPDCHPEEGANAPQSAPQAPQTPSWYKRALRVKNPLMQGADVRQVQRWLKADADGLYGPATESKVRGFQKLKGLTADGVVGPKTAAKLQEVYG